MAKSVSSSERIKTLETRAYKGQAPSRLDLLWLIDIARESSDLANAVGRDRRSASCVRTTARRVSAMLSAGPKAHLEARDTALDDEAS